MQHEYFFNLKKANQMKQFKNVDEWGHVDKPIQSKANFVYKIIGNTYDGEFVPEVLAIMDQNLGNRSVTNDIDNVVTDIELDNNYSFDYVMIVYRDSDQIWDGWTANPVSGNGFVALRCETLEDAIKFYSQMFY
jgi:hypothetical protein